MAMLLTMHALAEAALLAILWLKAQRLWTHAEAGLAEDTKLALSAYSWTDPGATIVLRCSAALRLDWIALCW